MKSKDLNEIFNKTRRTENISLTVEQVKELIKDLEVLEILKNQIDTKRGLDTFSKKPIYIIETKRFAFPLSEEKGQLIKEWLDDDR